MKQDANVTHQSNRINKENGTEIVKEDNGPGGNNVASVNADIAGREALRSMEMNEEERRKPSELTTGG